MTSITFIEAEELESRIRRGESWQISGSTTRGYGPVKAFVEVETQQPVPSNTQASVSVTIKNVGQGYIKDSAIKSGNFGIRLDGGPTWADSGSCEFEYQEVSIDGSDTDAIKIIRKESTPLFCKVKEFSSFDIEQTYDINAWVKYDYEFRRSLNIQIEPR